ncbi:MAG TPA: autotransporter domain-containing protein, partial [Lysobacter sp.]|nr:autotransporter domain-containing protein [Lysobacter sp.]
ALGPIPSLATQVNAYLTANGGRADANALYSVWGGANDLFAITSGGANPTTTIASAVTAQVGLVAQLQAAGARYILVPTIPDLGSTPAFRAQGATAQAQGTALSTAYNNALFGGLATGNYRVIPLDTFNLIREVVANPGAYGFSNVTGTACQPQITANSLTCNPTSYVTPTAATDYLFADGVHPTTSAHRLLADYAVAILEAPRLLAVLPHSAATVGRARVGRVAAYVDSPGGDGMAWWVDARGDSQRYDTGAGFDGIGPALTGGFGWRNGAMSYGVFGGLGRNYVDFGDRRGDFEQLDGTLGGYFGWRGDGAWVNAQLSYTWLRYDVDRELYLGPAKRSHEGSPDGSNLSLGVNAGWEFGSDSLRHGPVVGVLAQRIEIDGYAENDATLSTALAYPEQEYDSLIGSIGWRARFLVSEHLQPYAQVTYDREFEEYADEAFARVQSIPASGEYAVPGLQFDRSYGTVTVGTRTRLFGLDANLGLSATVGQEGGNDATVFATFGGGF